MISLPSMTILTLVESNNLSGNQNEADASFSPFSVIPLSQLLRHYHSHSNSLTIVPTRPEEIYRARRDEWNR